MKAHEKIKHLFFNLIRKTFIIVGHDFFVHEKFKPYWLTYIMYGLLALLYIGTGKTFFFYDLAHKLNITAFLGIGLQVKPI